MRTLILISVVAGFAFVAGEAAGRTIKIERDTAELVCGSMKSGDGGKNSGCTQCNPQRCYDINCKKGAKTCEATTVGKRRW
jgi:hypothetical protein